MSNVTAAVAKRQEVAAEVASRPPLLTLAREAIERQAVTLAKVMPQHLSRDRFEQITLAAIKATPKLLWCFETTEGQVSLLYSIIQAAAAGLEVGGLSAEAYLIPYEKRYRDDKGQWFSRWEARLQVSDRGVRDLGRRDPRVRELVADVVREGDHFVNRRTLDGEVFEHEVRGPSTRPLTHAYCLIRWMDGGGRAIVLDREEVEYIRDRYSEGYRADKDKPAAAQTNMWLTRPAKAWAKTAIHQARRELDLTPEVEEILAGATGPDDVPELPPLPELEPVDETPPANEDGEPLDPEPVELDPTFTGLLAAAGVDGDPGDDLGRTVPADITIDDLIAAGHIREHWDDKTGLGTIRKRLLRLAAEHCGATFDTPEQIIADQVAAEQLLARLEGRS